LYAAGILSCAFVLSGVTEFSFDVPAVHEPLASQMQHREEAVHLRFGTQGVIGDDATDDRMEATFGQSPEVLHVLVSRDEGAPLLLSGLAMLFAGLLGFLLTLWLTRLSLRGSWAYLRWNLGRLRAALEPATAAS
jgi:cytochrome c biogenesis protein ResB